MLMYSLGQLGKHWQSRFSNKQLFLMRTTIGMYSTVGNSCERGTSFGDVSMKINKTLRGNAIPVHPFISGGFNKSVF